MTRSSASNVGDPESSRTIPIIPALTSRTTWTNARVAIIESPRWAMSLPGV
jgi:hypothetical protein